MILRLRPVRESGKGCGTHVWVCMTQSVKLFWFYFGESTFCWQCKSNQPTQNANKASQTRRVERAPQGWESIRNLPFPPSQQHFHKYRSWQGVSVYVLGIFAWRGAWRHHIVLRSVALFHIRTRLCTQGCTFFQRCGSLRCLGGSWAVLLDDD